MKIAPTLSTILALQEGLIANTPSKALAVSTLLVLLRIREVEMTPDTLPASGASLTAELGLSPTSVDASIKRLLESGVIRRADPQPGQKEKHLGLTTPGRKWLTTVFDEKAETEPDRAVATLSSPLATSFIVEDTGPLPEPEPEIVEHVPDPPAPKTKAKKAAAPKTKAKKSK